MPNRNYQQGYRYEKVEQRYWEARGYHVCRSYGSKGDYDLAAFNGEEVVVIGVKSFRNRRGSYKASVARLHTIPKSPGLRRLHVEHGPIRQGKRTPRKETEV